MVRSIVRSMKEALPDHNGLPMIVKKDNIDLVDLMITLLCSQSKVRGMVPKCTELAKMVFIKLILQGICLIIDLSLFCLF